MLIEIMTIMGSRQRRADNLGDSAVADRMTITMFKVKNGITNEPPAAMKIRKVHCIAISGEKMECDFLLKGKRSNKLL